MILARKLALSLVALVAMGGALAYFVALLALPGSSSLRYINFIIFALVTSLSIILVLLIWL